MPSPDDHGDHVEYVLRLSALHAQAPAWERHGAFRVRKGRALREILRLLVALGLLSRRGRTLADQDGVDVLVEDYEPTRLGLEAADRIAHLRRLLSAGKEVGDG